MSLVKFQDPNIEKYLLASFLQGPAFWKDIPEQWFSEPVHQKAYKEFKKFLKPPYSTYPTSNLVIEKTEDADTKLLVTELEGIQVSSTDLNIRVHDMFDMYCSRKVYDIAQKIPDDLNQKKINNIVREKITILSELLNPFALGTVGREFIYDSAIERWLRYKGIEHGDIKNTAIPFCINELDKYTNGGLRKSHMMLIVAASGDFKTLTMLSLAYNYSFIERQDTMVLTLEVPGSGDQKDYQNMIDARHSLLEFNDIINGKLNVNRSVYREKLKDIADQKYPLYIVDIPEQATSADIIKEIEMYYAKMGKYPEVVIVDYLNEMSPVASYTGTSDKYKILASELRVIARMYNIRIVTAMQLNREGKKIKDGEKRDLENVSESHYVSNPFQVIVFLHRDVNGIDEATNQLHWTIRKNRYGQKNVTFSTFANPAFCYVGDRKVMYTGFEQ